MSAKLITFLWAPEPAKSKVPQPAALRPVISSGFHLQKKQLLTVGDLARWLNISKAWIYDHAGGRRQPVLPSVKLGKSLRFDEDNVNNWLKALSL